MAALFNIKIFNFRGIKSFTHTFSKGMTCIIGRGDSGKTTILDAISLVLSPSYSISFYDSDFYQCNVNEPIEIRATLIDLPEHVITKYGEYVVGIKDDKIIEDMESDDAETAITALMIKLTVDKNLEPSWVVYTENRGQEPKVISASDRAKLNMAYIADYSDRQFSLMKGNLLYSMYKQLSNEDDNINTFIDVIRNSKLEIDNIIDEKFQPIIDTINNSSKNFGLNMDNLKIEIDQKDIYVKDNKVSLHDGNIPLRLKGKGSKRLISLAVQLSQTTPNSIVLVDEIEIGLEPDRVQHLVNTLTKYAHSQIIFTTHSRDVLVELSCVNLYIMRQDNTELLSIAESMQGVVRSNPESFFASRILVCEGATEIGFCRAINNWRIKNGQNNFAYLGIRLVDGGGNSMIERASVFKKLGFDVCLFCDSDIAEINKKKQDLRDQEIEIIDCTDSYAFETQVFYDVPWALIPDLIACRRGNDISERNVFDSIQTNMNVRIDYTENWLDEEKQEIRNALAKTAGKKEWFKQISHGQFVGDLIMSKFDTIASNCCLKNNINKINNWIDNK